MDYGQYLTPIPAVHAVCFMKNDIKVKINNKINY